MNRSADGLISKNDMPKNFAGNTLNVVTNSMSPGSVIQSVNSCRVWFVLKVNFSHSLLLNNCIFF